MSIVDLIKARAYADLIAESEAEAADWIRELTDEVESLQRALKKARESEQTALADADRLFEERDRVVAALVDILGTINKIMPRV